MTVLLILTIFAELKVHLIHRKQVPLLHNTVLILCDEGGGFVAVKYISSRELKTSEFSLMLRLVKILLFSTHSMKYIWYSSQKSKYPLYITTGLTDQGNTSVTIFYKFIVILKKIIHENHH